MYFVDLVPLTACTIDLLTSFILVLSTFCTFELLTSCTLVILYSYCLISEKYSHSGDILSLIEDKYDNSEIKYGHVGEEKNTFVLEKKTVLFGTYMVKFWSTTVIFGRNTVTLSTNSLDGNTAIINRHVLPKL